jgi:hypothetical protein
MLERVRTIPVIQPVRRAYSSKSPWPARSRRPASRCGTTPRVAALCLGRGVPDAPSVNRQGSGTDARRDPDSTASAGSALQGASRPPGLLRLEHGPQHLASSATAESPAQLERAPVELRRRSPRVTTTIGRRLRRADDLLDQLEAIAGLSSTSIRTSAGGSGAAVGDLARIAGVHGSSRPAPAGPRSTSSSVVDVQDRTAHTFPSVGSATESSGPSAQLSVIILPPAPGTGAPRRHRRGGQSARCMDRHLPSRPPAWGSVRLPHGPRSCT